MQDALFEFLEKYETMILTLCSPHGFHDFDFDHEDHRSNNDGSKGGFRNEREVRREEHQRKYDQRSSIDVG